MFLFANDSAIFSQRWMIGHIKNAQNQGLETVAKWPKAELWARILQKPAELRFAIHGASFDS